MGKVRTRVLGDEEAEKKQKAEAKQKAAEKKVKKVEVAEDAAAVEAVTEEKASKKVKKSAPAKAPATQTKKHGKKYQAAKKQVDTTKFYSLNEAIEVLKKVKFASFDESVEVHLNVEKTGLKGEVSLPHSTGKTTKVAVVDDALLEKLESGVVEFDVLVTHPSYMPKLAKYAKLLGPRGLMPNPKAGTISPNPEELVKKFSGGTLRWKSEPKFPIVHQMVGKVSFKDDELSANVKNFIQAVGKVNVKSAYLTTTMGPGLKLNIESL